MNDKLLDEHGYDVALLRAICDHPVAIAMQERAKELMRPNNKLPVANEHLEAAKKEKGQ